MPSDTRVLLIDDDEDFRASTRSLLEGEGYSVSEATSGRDGLKQALADRPDVIVLDIMMETLEEGYGVTQAIKFQEEFRDCRDIPILMVSSIRESPDERFPRAGEVDMVRPDRYLTKPIDIPRFLELIERVTRGRRASRV
jgi:CheY-like chemotaxis protein